MPSPIRMHNFPAKIHDSLDDNCRPLLVRIWIETPVLLNSPVMLDGILASIAVERANGDLAAQEALLLRRRFVGDDWIWMASAGLIESNLLLSGPGEETIGIAITSNGTFRDISLIPGKGGKISVRTKSGWHQNAQTSFSRWEIPHLSFLAMGRRDEVDDLLSSIVHASMGDGFRCAATGIGAKRGTGYGRVSDISVIELDPDIVDSLNFGLIDQDHRLLRPVPVDLFDIPPQGMSEIHYRSSPPYWKADGRMPCLAPAMDGVIRVPAGYFETIRKAA